MSTNERPERIFTLVVEVVTDLTDDELFDLARQYRYAEDGTDVEFTDVEDAASEIIEFGLIYDQGLGDPTQLDPDSFTLGDTYLYPGRLDSLG